MAIQTFSKIWIIVILIIFTAGGIFGWRYWKMPIENLSKEVITNYTEEESVEEKNIKPEIESPKEGGIQEEKSAKKEIITPPCQDECSQTGVKRCSNNGYQICGNYDGDGCLEWSSTIFCPSGTSCRIGNCAVISTTRPGVEYWAVLLTTHKNNLEPLLLKNILINNGWKEDHIRYLLDEDANRGNLLDSLNWLRANSDANDIILFYSSSHGLPSNMELMSYSDLAKEFDNIKYGGLAIAINACYSGSAISHLQGGNRVILTSSGENEIADWDFHTQFFHALQGLGDVEGDNNDWVSIEEAFNFLKPTSAVRPYIQDNYPGELNITFLNGGFSYLDQYNIADPTPINYTVGAPIKEYPTSIAQSFKPNYPILTKAMLELYKQEGPAPGPLAVSIRKDLSGPDLASITVQQDTFFSSDIPQFYEFDFPDIAVTANETHFIVIESPDAIYGGGTYLNGYNFRGGKNNYLNGEVEKVRYPDWLWPVGEYDLFFVMFGKPK